ncbi:MAG: fumarate hydratase, partial [FCB group bacterium]|nr:fumarate hydratase [FCB group bacterium]
MMIKPQAPDFIQTCVALIRQASCDLPEDVISALQSAQFSETPDSIAYDTLGTILHNIELARTQRRPLCQDTGVPCFSLDIPAGTSAYALREKI